MPSQTIHVSGVVQGVGFRPFVYNLANDHRLTGEVRNTSAGVDIVVEGSPESLQSFVQHLRADAPPLARIENLEVRDTAQNGYTRFEIRESLAQLGAFQPIPPDVALCPACEAELFDPADPRYLYPFINCTHCGPRYTIIRGLPYDRPATTMAGFPLCPRCLAEYKDPADRRFHAQPVACPICGPQLELIIPGQSAPQDQHAILLAVRRLLSQGAIVALKGLGGFHLACDASNEQAVSELRRRKGRGQKPLAVMVASLAIADSLASINPAERALLTGSVKPIVLLKRLPGSFIAPAVAPGAATLGVMLPYTPLHHLLLNQTDPTLAAQPAPTALVMTSGNFSEEPIVRDNAEALQLLRPLADAFLLHNREIHIRCDDSVVRSVSQPVPSTLIIRRARGYAPAPIDLPFNAPAILATGGHLKNTLCLTRQHSAFLSQHNGDLENAETLAAFEENARHLSRLFNIQPTVIAHDLHPDYISTRWALKQTASGQRHLAIQHHHAHIASVLADNGWNGSQPVIGIAYDGTGLGTDGAIWGGEFLIADYDKFHRAAHLEYLPLPGGDAATRKPWRIAVGYATALGLDLNDLPFLADLDPKAVDLVRLQVQRQINTPRTSSLGRLFDAVAALCNLRTTITYEAQAALDLEAAALTASTPSEPYPYHLEPKNGVLQIRLAALLNAICRDVRLGLPAGQIAAKFQHTLAALTLEVCRALRRQTGLSHVALSGGVWQNAALLQEVHTGLLAEGFQVFTHQQVPANDGGLALGQAAIAAHQLNAFA